MTNGKGIASETSLIWSAIKAAFRVPWNLVLSLFGKKRTAHVLHPIKEVVSQLTAPKVTTTLIILNIVAFIYSLTLDEGTFASLLLYPDDILSGRIISLFTSGFLHADYIHLLGNMFALFIFGRVVERKLGGSKTAITYLGAMLIAGAFTSLIHVYVMQDNTPGLGASGAIMGLVATSMLLDPFYLTFEFIIPLPILFVGWLMILADVTGVLNPAEDGIGHFAHIGGFVSIALLGFFLGIADRRKLSKGLAINIFSALALLIAFLLLLRN